jgi:hypothetical protein
MDIKVKPELPSPEELDQAMTDEDRDHEQSALVNNRLEGLYSDDYEIYLTRLAKKGYITVLEAGKAAVEYDSGKKVY